MTRDTEFELRAPSRLHFGLLSFGRNDRPQYGGLGVMVEQPGLTLAVDKASAFTSVGEAADRVAEFSTSWQRATQLPLPAVRLQLTQVPAQHVGLGTGTQLGLTVAAALYAASQRPVPPAETLAQVANRAKRSSVGTYGFDRGGLIYELGKRDDEPVGKLSDHVLLPETWRVTLLTPTRDVADEGLSGTAEQQAFGKLPTVPTTVTERLMELAEQAVLPAARSGDLAAFGEAIYEYGLTAGHCFDEAQGGPFATRQLEAWVRAIRDFGIRGVGQSSWGPTLFAFHANEEEALAFSQWCRRQLPGGDQARIQIAAIARRGAQRTPRGL